MSRTELVECFISYMVTQHIHGRHERGELQRLQRGRKVKTKTKNNNKLKTREKKITLTPKKTKIDKLETACNMYSLSIQDKKNGKGL